MRGKSMTKERALFRTSQEISSADALRERETLLKLTANCIMSDHFCIWTGIGRPVSLRCVIKRLGSSQNGPKFEPRRVSKPFLRFSSWP
eukprot:COSAG06_NODE_917_length_11555_cov_62.488041_3_plen_89_part_00